MLAFSQAASLPANRARVFCDPILSRVSLAAVDSGAELIGACVWPRAAPLSQAPLLILHAEHLLHAKVVTVLHKEFENNMILDNPKLPQRS